MCDSAGMSATVCPSVSLADLVGQRCCWSCLLEVRKTVPSRTTCQEEQCAASGAQLSATNTQNSTRCWKHTVVRMEGVTLLSRCVHWTKSSHTGDVGGQKHTHTHLTATLGGGGRSVNQIVKHTWSSLQPLDATVYNLLWKNWPVLIKSLLQRERWLPHPAGQDEVVRSSSQGQDLKVWSQQRQQAWPHRLSRCSGIVRSRLPGTSGPRG